MQIYICVCDDEKQTTINLNSRCRYDHRQTDGVGVLIPNTELLIANPTGVNL